MSLSSIPSKLKPSNGHCQSEQETWFSQQMTRNFEDIKSVEMWQACFAEFVGVFFLVFFTIGVGISKDGEESAPLLQGALGTGFFITVIITSLSTVSGGHVNPAISIGFLVTNRITFIRFVLYTVFQATGGMVGAVVLKAILPKEYRGSLGLIQPGNGVPPEQALAMEIMITSLLLFGTIAFTDSHREDVQGSIPYMVGLTVCVNILTGGKVSGGCMNPARALAPAVVQGNMDLQWIYWVGPLIGGASGAFIYDSFFSTRPLGIIANAIKRTKPGSQRRKRLSGGDEPDTDLIEVTENTKLQA